MRLQLNKPIKLTDTKTIDALVFRDEATAEDLLAFDMQGANKQTIALIASLTGNDEAVIKRLRVDDFRAADKIVEKLLFPESATLEDAQKNV